jgi:hypothetical protein
VFCTDTCSFNVTVTQKPGTIFYRDWDLDGWGNTNSPDNFIDCLDEAWPSSLNFREIVMTETLPAIEVYNFIMIMMEMAIRIADRRLPPICYGDEWPPIWSLSNPETNPDIKVTSLGIDADDSDPSITIKYLFQGC